MQILFNHLIRWVLGGEMRTKLILLIYILFFSGINTLSAEEFMFKATVQTDFVLLSWDEMGKIDGFNIYRKTDGGTYTKINPFLIIPLTDCTQINTVIPSHSPEATAISRTLHITSCEINGANSDKEKDWFKARSALSLRYYKIAEVRGIAYEDHGVVSGQTYFYMIKSVKDGVEKILKSDLEVKAGVVVLLPAPPSTTAEAGDARIFITWGKIENAIAYQIFRSTAPGGSYGRITPPSGTSGLFKHDPITNDTMLVNKPGFLDTLCLNNTTYNYKVQATDLLGRLGSESSIVSATPRDMTPPLTPAGILVQPLTLGLRLTWAKIDTDIVRRPERVQKYSIYRYISFINSTKDTLGILAGRVRQPADTVINVNFVDSMPFIQPETIYWYRVCCEDSAIPLHNFSNKSAPVSGFFKDPFPPNRPTGLTTDAYEDSILLRWNPPPDADLAGFYIYRGICGCETVYVFRNDKQQTMTHLTTGFRRDTVELTENRPPGVGWRLIRIYCRPYNLALIGNIDSAGARKYPDRSVPKGSPICYRYAMRAYDKSQNLSVMSDSVCDRLKDRTGPSAPVIAGLYARDKAVLVQWVSPPIQDLFGFIVERATDPAGLWEKISPDLAVPDPSTVGCKCIPATSNWADSMFSYLDTKDIRPKINYWYRVRGVDYMGNAGNPSPEIGTFAYDRHLPALPMNLQIVDTTQCTMTLTWDPSYNAEYLGFVVFRSKKFDSGYHQISPIIRENKFKDEHLVRGETYYYQVQYYAKDGNRSKPSAPKIHTVH